MKKLFALFLVALTLLSLCFSLTSCGKTEEFPGSKATQVNLKFNFYETTVIEKDDFTAKQSVIVKADSEISSVEELAGKTVAVQKASAAKTLCEAAGYTIVEFSTANDVKTALLSGEADVAVTDGNSEITVFADKNADGTTPLFKTVGKLAQQIDDELLAKIVDADSSRLRSVIKAEKEGDKVVIFHCLTENGVEKIKEKYSYLAEEYGEDYFCQTNGKVVFIGTKDGLRCATKQLWHNRLYHTFIEGQNYNYILNGLKNTLIITLCSLVIVVVLGTIIAIVKYFS